MFLKDLGRRLRERRDVRRLIDRQFDATVLTTCIPGFTERCQTMEPREVSRWVNGIFRDVTESVLGFGGTPVKYIGDAFLAFFAGADHRRRSILASIGARESTTQALIVSVASGPIHMASIGHSTYARPDILGDVVNRAFRINGWAAAHANSRIAASDDTTAGLLDSFVTGDVQSVSLKSISTPVRLREIIAVR